MLTPQQVRECRERILGFPGGGVSDYDDPHFKEQKLRDLYGEILKEVAGLSMGLSELDKLDNIIKCAKEALGYVRY